MATLKALACELPARREPPLGRYSIAALARRIAAHPAAPPLSASTIWRIRDTDALKPWRHQGWRCPRDPTCAAKAGRVLALYAGWWDGRALAPAACIVSADEQTSIQARARCHATTPPRPARPMRGEHAYARGGALASLAAWDVRSGGLIGRCAATTGSAPFGRLVDQALQREPYRAAARVFWIGDNGSSHRGATAAQRLQGQYPNLLLVHLPTHASWRNQRARFCSIVQRKALTPNDFADLAAVEQRLLAFAAWYNDTAVPFHWRFTRPHLDDRLAALSALPPPRPALGCPLAASPDTQLRNAALREGRIITSPGRALGAG